MVGDGVEETTEERHEAMKIWRRGFIRCRRREGPWGSHHEEARREKWESSVGETEDWAGLLRSCA